MYKDGIENLKHQKLHPKLQNENTKYLIDIYYKEEQMNSFRDSLIRSLEKLRIKIDNHLARVSDTSRRQGESVFSNILIDERLVDGLLGTLQDDFIDEKEPLIVSIIHTVHQNLS